MNDHLKANFGVCILFVMFCISVGCLVHLAHYSQDGNGVLECVKGVVATVVGGIVGIVTGSKLQQRSTDLSTTPDGDKKLTQSSTTT